MCNGFPECDCDDVAFLPAIHEYPHTGAVCCVVGGYVYRGSAIPRLDGTYFFADYCGGHVFSFEYDGSTLSDLRDRTLELDPEGDPVFLSTITAPASYMLSQA